MRLENVCFYIFNLKSWTRYHFDGSTRKFFEGWYFKVAIPERKQSFCFMYSVENPAFKKELSSLELAQHGPRFTGVGVQILGADDKYLCNYSKESLNFWGSKFLPFYVKLTLNVGLKFSVEEKITMVLIIETILGLVLIYHVTIVSVWLTFFCW